MKKTLKVCPRCTAPLTGRTPSCKKCAENYTEEVDKFFVTVYNRVRVRHPGTNLSPQYLQ